MARCPIQEIAKRASAAGIPFLVIGGYAAFAHGYVRATDDLDLIVPRGRRAQLGKLLGDLLQLILINRLDLNEPELRATILKHGNAETYEKLRQVCANE
jgi:hypothetical protein